MAYSIRFPRRHDKADRNGRYAVRLCITKNKRRKYIALELYADPAYSLPLPVSFQDFHLHQC